MKEATVPKNTILHYRLLLIRIRVQMPIDVHGLPEMAAWRMQLETPFSHIDGLHSTGNAVVPVDDPDSLVTNGTHALSL